MVDLRYRFKIPMIFIIGLMIFMSSIPVFAEKQLVYDDAFLFSDSQIQDLEDRANELSDEFNLDIVITTTDDAEGKSSRDYADDYFDYGGFGRGTEYDGILFLIDMDNREAYISTTGIGIRYLTDERIERVLDRVFDSGLSNGDYYGAAMGFLSKTEEYLVAGIPSNQHTVEEKEPNRITFIDVIIGLIGGTGAGGLFYGGARSRYKMRNPGNPYSYRNNSIVNLASKNDNLVDTIVTHRVIPRPKPSSGSGGGSSGRSTTHRSSSGRSHGGGGRKF